MSKKNAKFFSKTDFSMLKTPKKPSTGGFGRKVTVCRRKAVQKGEPQIPFSSS